MPKGLTPKQHRQWKHVVASMKKSGKSDESAYKAANAAVHKKGKK